MWYRYSFTAPPVFVLGSANPFKESGQEVTIQKGTLALSHPGQEENVTPIIWNCGLGCNAVWILFLSCKCLDKKKHKSLSLVGSVYFLWLFQPPTNSTFHLLHMEKPRQAGREAYRWLGRSGQWSTGQYMACLSDREGKGSVMVEGHGALKAFPYKIAGWGTLQPGDPDSLL